LQIRGPLDVRLLARAISVVVARHELLGCGFRSVRDRVVRFRAVPDANVIRVIDVSALLGRTAQHWMDMLRIQLEQWRLDPAAPPLLRFCLVRVDAQTSILWMAIHHIVCDEHSNAILCREILTAYAGRGFDRPAGSFTDLLHAQNEQLGVTARRAYWRQIVADCDISGPIQQLNRRFRSTDTRDEIRSLSHVLEDADAARVEHLCRTFRCTPSVLFLGLMQLWLARSSAGICPPVCVPMQLRDDLDEDEMFGMLTNLVVMNFDSALDDTAPTFFQRLRKRFYEAWNHRRTPFSEVAAMLAGQRDVAIHPLSRYMFALETPPDALATLGDLGLRVEPLRADTAIPGSELALIVTRGTRQTALRVQYQAKAIARGWAESALPQMLVLLRALAASPTMRLADIALRAPAIRRNWAPPSIARRTVYERFRDTALRLGDRTAIYGATSTHSYAELHERVDALTSLLLAEGVTAGARVGIALRRGPDLIAAQIATLRLGAAHVPISADWSPAVFERIAAQLPLILVDGSVAGEYPAECKTRTLNNEQGTLPHAFREPEIPPESIAYVLYTSGSTGEPKGVAVSHRALECFIEWSAQYFGRPEEIVVCGFTPMIFDMSISEILVPPCTGMSTVLVDHAAEAYARPHWNEVTWITGVPTVLRELLKSAPLPARIRTVSFGGEELDCAIVERIHRAAPGARVLNLYGPTEITVYATGADLPPSGAVDPVPIGQPLPFHDVRVVDSALNELPHWAVGQLVVGGPCVATGYLNASDTTAERFIPNPFTDEAGARLHLTGDLGFADAGGQIHLVGRMDSQEKILGVRVHLGGVEATLRRHPLVADAACFVMNKGSASAYLAAALVSHSEQGPAADELRAWMQRVCTASHIPRQWAWFDKFPTRPGGKVDRTILHADLERGLRSQRPSVLSPEESAVLAIWRDVVDAGIDAVDSNFFDAGGNSLHLPRLCAGLQSLGLTFGLQQVFEFPTVRAQARLLETQQRAGVDESTDPLAAVYRRGESMRQKLAQLESAGPVR
jgi:amino acid adenylation domain-containing protein